MRTFLAHLLRLGGMHLVLASVAVVRNKVLAARLDVAGYGEFAQVALLAVGATVIVGAGWSTSLNRNVASTADVALRTRYLATANTLTVITSAVLAAVVAPSVFAWPDAWASVGVDMRPEVRTSVLLLLAFVPLDVAVQHRIAFLTGAMDIAGMTRGRSLALVLATVATVPLVWTWGWRGAAVQLVVVAAVLCVALDARLRRLGIAPWQFSFDRSTVRLLAAFGTAALVAGVVQRGSDVGLRTWLVRHEGASANGLYQAALGIAMQAKAVAMGGLGSLAVSSFSRETDTVAVAAAATRMMRVAAPLTALALGLATAFGDVALGLLYAPAFADASDILAWLVIAEFVLLPAWIAGPALLASGRLGPWVVSEALAGLARISLGVGLGAWMGSVGAAAGVAVGSLVHAVGVSIYVHVRHGVRIGAPGWWAAATGAVWICLAGASASLPWGVGWRIVVVSIAAAVYLTWTVQRTVGVREVVRRAVALRARLARVPA